MNLRQIALGAVLILVASGPARAAQPTPTAPDPAKVKTIRVLLEVTGEVKLAQQAMNQMMETLRQRDDQLPDEFWARMKKKFVATDLVELLIPVYDKYYTKEDLTGLVAFYRSPLGQKVVASLPKITAESMTVGQVWGQKKAREILEEMQKAHPTQKSSRRDGAKPGAS